MSASEWLPDKGLCCVPLHLQQGGAGPPPGPSQPHIGRPNCRCLCGAPGAADQALPEHPET
eukprot:1043691-Pelagomonas_calceolata.AAC.1